MNKLTELELWGIGAAALVGAFLIWKGFGAAKGALTGDNALTRGATDAAGDPVSAYQGAGIVGTAGAATNAASGGVLASVGEWLGSKTADLLQRDPMADTSDSLAKYNGIGNAGSDGSLQSLQGITSWD